MNVILFPMISGLNSGRMNIAQLKIISSTSLLIVLCLFVNAALAGTVSEHCQMDLNALPTYLLENDTGAKNHLKQKGQAHFDVSLASASKAASVVHRQSDCNEVLRTYLASWRKGHLGIEMTPDANLVNVENAGVASNTQKPQIAQITLSKEPTLKFLSKKTLLLTLPSFSGQYHAPLLALIQTHKNELAAHANWIIDVRANDGGSDSTYAPLLPWLMADEVLTIGVEWLASPANIEAQKNLCMLIATGRNECDKMMEELVEKLRSVTPGQYVAHDGTHPDGLYHYRVSPMEKRRPKRVAVLVDHACGSSCEQFLLTVRQSFNVKLIGRNSYGALDYSNIRPHVLPSGQRMLLYATSRSVRIPHLQVDINGIMPDIFLPPPVDDTAREAEVQQVKSWLEGGTFKKP